MIHPTDLVDKSIDRSRLNDRSLVDDRRRARRVGIRDAAMFLAALVAVFFAPELEPGTWQRATANIYLGAYIGLTAMNGLRRASAYRSGWIEGRGAMMRSLDEAHRRGMTAAEWIESQYARDAAIFGLPPIDFTDHDE